MRRKPERINKANMIKKGYVFIVLFALFLSILGPLKYKLYIKRDFDVVSLNDLILQIIIAFFAYLIPGLLMVRWYYKMKNK